MDARKFLKSQDISFKKNIELLKAKEDVTKLLYADFLEEDNVNLRFVKLGLVYSYYVELIAFLLYNSLNIQDCKSAGQVFSKLNNSYLSSVDYKVRNSIQHLDFRIENGMLYCKNLQNKEHLTKKELELLLNKTIKIYEDLKKELV